MWRAPRPPLAIRSRPRHLPRSWTQRATLQGGIREKESVRLRDSINFSCNPHNAGIYVCPAASGTSSSTGVRSVVRRAISTTGTAATMVKVRNDHGSVAGWADTSVVCAASLLASGATIRLSHGNVFNIISTSLAGRKSCAITVTWLRTSGGGELSVTDNGGGSPQTASLIGIKRCTPP